MPLFLSNEEYEQCGHDASLVAAKADEFIRELYNQLETVKAQADAASITAEQTCSLLEQKYVSLSSEFSALQSQYSQLNSNLDQRLSEVAQLQAEKHEIQLQSTGKDGEIGRLSAEVSELHKSKRQLMELLEQKDLEISEKNATIKSYLDRIVNMTDNSALRETRLSELESEVARAQALCSRLSQEKELVERHNSWLNDELTAKVDSLIQLRKINSELEADMSAKLAEDEKKFNASASSLKWNKERVMELELKLSSIEKELLSSKDAAAASEEQLSAEISTLTKLVDLYKESSEEWSKKAGELEGVIKALEIHLNQVENDYKERLEKEVSARKEVEKEAECLKEKLGTCEAELESTKENKLRDIPSSDLTAGFLVEPVVSNEMIEDDRVLVPTVPAGISGTALAASLLRDGWSLAKMYAKYQEVLDALRHEQLGRKQSQAILERVLYEIEEKAGLILDERAEHERLVEAYSILNEKLQHSVSEQATLEQTIQDLKADLRRCERDYSIAQKETVDLQKQVALLLKECRDVQLRCGALENKFGDDILTGQDVFFNAQSDAENTIPEQLLTFKDINGLVEQNVHLRSLVRDLSDQIDNRELKLKEEYEKELRKHNDEAANKVNAVLTRAEEQGRMIESLHNSVAMYKKLYEEEHKFHSPGTQPQLAATEDVRMVVRLLPEGPQGVSKNAQEQAVERAKCLEEDLTKLRGEILSLRTERDKLALEAQFAQGKVDRFMKELEHQRDEHNGVLARNVEFSQLVIDYQRKLRESSESVNAAEELARKLKMEVSVLKHEKEILLNSEKRASDEVRSLSERVHRLQATLDTIQSTEEVREEARSMERRRQEEYIKQIEREWAEAKKELQEERDNVRSLMLERENATKDILRQVEDLGKELANALHAVAAAESRAAISEARCADLEERIKFSKNKSFKESSQGGPSILTDEVPVGLNVTKEEIEKLREEAQVNKDHMLQYKSIAQVNEEALKQMELAHERFKVEADKVKESLEKELLSVMQRVNELETECNLRTEEAARAASGKEEAMALATSEIASLKEDVSVKLSQIAIMETRISALGDDLEKEHQKCCAARANYERQVILQSETIQELSRTSKALVTLQEEASELRKLTDTLKIENSELKAKWEAEKSMLEVARDEADKKYSEVNEQNKILHSRLEALHIKLAEKDRHSSGITSGSAHLDEDDGLQGVVKYLRRSKEIAETEISLLKQERLRLQSQLESVLKAAETAQASLHAERENSRALLFTEQEFKALQHQVQEVNLLRESNVQLREENKHNFEECQKLREAGQKAKVETENMEKLLKGRENEVEACRKEIEMLKMQNEHLRKRVDELLERYQYFDVEDYNRSRDALQQMQASISEKNGELDETKRLVSEKQEIIAHLEQDLAKSRMELSEKETRINEIVQNEASLKSEIEKQRRLMAQLKKRSENLMKEKEELSKENHVLSKQLEDARQGKRISGDLAGEHALKEKEKEKDTRIQILEKTVERLREELKKEKDDHKTEKAKRLKTQKTISDSYETVTQQRLKLLDELEKHKQALKMHTDEVEKLKDGKDSQSEGTSAVIPSGTLLEELTSSYLLAVDTFERVAHPVCTDPGATSAADSSTALDTSSLAATIGVGVSSPAPIILSPPTPVANFPIAKVEEEREKKLNLSKTNAETRKTGRKLVRPRITKPEEPQGDTEMQDIDGSNNGGKPPSSHSADTQGNLILPTHVRKRPSTSSTAESAEELSTAEETISDLAQPVLKRSKGSEAPQEGEEKLADSVEISESHRPSEEYDMGDLTQGFKEESIDAAKDEGELVWEQSEEPMVDATDQVESQNDGTSVVDENLEKPNEPVDNEDQSNFLVQQDIQLPETESGSEREEGELVTDSADIEGIFNVSNTAASPEIGEVQPDHITAPDILPIADVQGAMDSGDMDSSQFPDEEKNDRDSTEEITESSDRLTDGNDQVAETDQVPEIPLATGEKPSGLGAETSVSKQGVPSTETEGKQVSPVSRSSTTINLHERARLRASIRQAGMLPSSLSRGRGRAPRGRGGRGGRSGRGQSGEQA